MDKVKSLIESIEKLKIIMLENESIDRKAYLAAKWCKEKLERDLKKAKSK